LINLLFYSRIGLAEIIITLKTESDDKLSDYNGLGAFEKAAIEHRITTHPHFSPSSIANPDIATPIHNAMRQTWSTGEELLKTIAAYKKHLDQSIAITPEDGSLER